MIDILEELLSPEKKLEKTIEKMKVLVNSKHDNSNIQEFTRLKNSFRDNIALTRLGLITMRKLMEERIGTIDEYKKLLYEHENLSQLEFEFNKQSKLYEIKNND